MTISEAARFYNQDPKEYELEKNPDFLNWLKKVNDNGYCCFLEIEKLQELIDFIAKWYEIKYPERELEFFEGIVNIIFYDIKSLSKEMNFRQLLYRLPHNQLSLIEGGYRAKGGGQNPIYENGKCVGWESKIAIKINRKNIDTNDFSFEKTPYFLLCANQMTGKVIMDYDLEEYLDNENNLYLDELLKIFNNKYSDELDFTELKEVLYNHHCDIRLRNKILELVALKLLYSEKTIPERGYERAKRFINEFNKNLNISLSTKRIDEIMNRDYSIDESPQNIVKGSNNQRKNKHFIKSLLNKG